MSSHTHIYIYIYRYIHLSGFSYNCQVTQNYWWDILLMYRIIHAYCHLYFEFLVKFILCSFFVCVPVVFVYIGKTCSILLCYLCLSLGTHNIYTHHPQISSLTECICGQLVVVISDLESSIHHEWPIILAYKCATDEAALWRYGFMI